MIVQGRVDSAFEPVRREMERNFVERGEVGASVCVYVEGRAVVDAWGGLANPRDRAPWRADTIVLVFSSTKAATSLCAHRLAAKGALDLDAPIARYWPGFARSGKEAITVRMALSHRAGLPAVDEPLPVEAAYDWTRMTQAIEAQAPHWEPGTQHGYHPFTFGWIVGEVVRRVAGQSLGAYFRQGIGEPLELELWIGLPEQHEPRVARILAAPPPESPTPFIAALLDKSSLTARAFLNPATFFAPREPNSRAMRAAEIPSANGVASARGLARLYAALAEGGTLDGDRGPGHRRRGLRVAGNAATQLSGSTGLARRLGLAHAGVLW
jgi:CubicO group peptidase (beta-lactamase class C family)